MLVLALVVLLVGVVGAFGVITNISDLTLHNFTAGSLATANFSFDYPSFNATYPNQRDDAPLMIKVDIVSSDSNYSVWKGDFDLGGSVVNHGWWVLPDREYTLDCREDDFSYKYGSWVQEITDIPNGTFYCFNPQFSAMRAGSSNDVVLNIGSEPALWPGEYNFSVGLYYPIEEYIVVGVIAVNGSNYVGVGENGTVVFNMSFEISGGNAIRMKLSDLVDGYVAPDGIGFVIGDGASYTPEELNARLVYEGVNYSVGNDYSDMNETIVFDVVDGIAWGSALFMMDVDSGMLSGNYHGTYRFDVTQEIV